MQQDTFTVYIVDDDEAVRRALERLLRSADYSAVTFASAEEFLSATSGQIQGCLVLDILLPGMNGLDLQERIRSRGEQCPVIFMTAHDHPQWRDRAREMGALAYLRKPFHEQSLLDAIQSGNRPRS